MRYLVPALLAAAAAAPHAPAQQLALALNDNPSYGSYAVGWPASVIGFRFTANTTSLVAAQVFTGNQPPAVHSVEIRTRNATTGLPDQLVGAAGTWTTTHTRCWQGAIFAQPATLTPNADYFLVWRVQGMFHQHSLSADTEPSNVLVETHVNDGSMWFGMSQQAGKFRLFAPYQAGTTSAYGTGKAGQYGIPTIGLGNAARNVPAVLVLGTPIPSGVPIGFADLWVTPDLLLTVITKTHTNPLVGGLDVTVFVPNAPAAVGFPLSFQFGIFDAMALDGFSHTSAVTATIQ